MKELFGKIIANLHVLIVLYGLWDTYVKYDEHTIQKDSVVSEVSEVDNQIQAAEKKIKEIDEFTKKTDDYRMRVEAVVKNIESVQRQLPAETSDNQILTYLQSEIKSLNIKDASFVPGNEQPSTYYISKNYELKAEGTFLQFLIFFERIANADRIYNVDNFKLVSPSGGARGRFQIISGSGSIQAFRYNPEFKVDRESKQ